MNRWRLLSFREDNAAMQMAIDEALLINGGVNTLRFYCWNPPAISIGFFQSVEKEVDLEKLNEYQYDIVRRYTGGGAVFHDQEITYSIMINEKDVSQDILKSYQEICQGVILGLKKLGLACEFKPINDILVNGKKISGNAQTRRNGFVLQHGTILIGVDVEKMFTVLRVDDEKIKDKMIKDVKERVTSINDELGKKIDFFEVVNALKKGFSNAFDVDFFEDDLTDEELVLAKKLYEEKYNAKEWLYQR